jgi:LemA protein
LIAEFCLDLGDSPKSIKPSLREDLSGVELQPIKSNDNFKQLQNRVSDLESQLSDRRETYNDAATNFNTRIEQIPDIIVARSLNYQAREMFKMEPLEKQKPKLKMKLPQ